MLDILNLKSERLGTFNSTNENEETKLVFMCNQKLYVIRENYSQIE